MFRFLVFSVVVVVCSVADAESLTVDGATKLLEEKGGNLRDQDLASICTAISLRELDLTGCRRLTNAGAENLRSLTSLEKLVLARSTLANEKVLEVVGELPRLVELDLSDNTSFRGDGLERLTQIKTLNLACGRGALNDKGLEKISGLTNLVNLNLDGCDQITDRGLRHLEGLTNLKSLGLYGCHKITSPGFTRLFQKLTSLERLNIAFCWWHEGRELELPPRLVHLDLHESKRLQDEAIVPLKKQDLRTLNLFQCLVLTDKSLEQLGGLKKLESLDLGSIRALTDEGLAHLRDTTNLTYLNLCDNDNFTGAGLLNLSDMTSLRDLNLWYCTNITNDGLRAMQGMRELQRLVLADCKKIGDEGLGHLRGNVLVSELYLDNCKGVTDKGLEHLAAMTKLTELTLTGCDKLTDRGLERLATFRSLRYLAINECPNLSSAAIARLKTALPDCKVLD